MLRKTSEPKPASANGFVLAIDGYWVYATWPAPFFVLSRSERQDGTPEEPGLIHCEDLDHAKLHAPSGLILDAQFLAINR